MTVLIPTPLFVDENDPEEKNRLKIEREERKDNCKSGALEQGRSDGIQCSGVRMLT